MKTNFVFPADYSSLFQKMYINVFIHTASRWQTKLITHSPSSSPLPDILLGCYEQRHIQITLVMGFYFKDTW